jgi:flagellar export protein FliJ
MGRPGRFQFSLARVLGVREIERRIAGARVAEATARVRDAAARLRDSERARDELLRELGFLRSAPRIDLTACLSVEALLEGARDGVARSAAALAEREAERETALAAHSEAHKKVRALDRLSEIRRDEHSQERRRWESKNLDEVAAVRARAGAAAPALPPAEPPLPNP